MCVVGVGVGVGGPFHPYYCPNTTCALVAWACPLREQSMVTRWGPLRAGWLTGSAVLRAVPAGPSGCSVDAVLHAHSEVGPALSRPRLA